MRNRKKNFSLMELFISIALIGMIGSFVSIRIGARISLHKFNTNVEKVLSLIEYSRNIAITNQSDVTLLIEQNSEGIKCNIEEEGLKPSKKHPCYNDKKFSSLFLSFNGNNASTLELFFSSTGNIYPAGKMCFSNDKSFDKGKSKDIMLQDIARIKTVDNTHSK
jgi:Tfp pilus assembly protein FimT